MTRQEQIFVGFLVREGWSHQQATLEVGFLRNKTRDEYFCTTRVGTNKKLSRCGKIYTYGTWENSKNHAAFEQELTNNS